MPGFKLSDDFVKCSLATLLPGAAGVVSFAVFCRDKKETEAWWMSLKKPEWAPKDITVYTVVDSLVALPLGCASFLVYKHGGGFEEKNTAIALGVYGANLALACISVPIMLKKKDVKLTLGLSTLIAVSGAASAALFYKVHPTAGIMMLPWTLWSGFYVALMYSVWKEESKAKTA